MKLFNFLIVLLLFFSTIKAQQKELKGYLGVEHGESYTYKLVFTDSSGHINGYAYTWLYEQKEVKAAITGFIDKKNKTLSFKETHIIYNHGFESNTTICLISAVLKYKQENGNTVFSGSISSSDASNVYCGQGTVSFIDNEVLKNLFTEPIKKDKPLVEPAPKKPMKIIYDTAATKVVAHPQNKFASPLPEKITAGVEKAYDWKTDTVIVDVWDGGHVDGDIVTILFNNVNVLNKYVVTKSYKKITLPLSENENTLIIIANNEGNEPPNTTNLLLTDGDVQYSVIAYNAVGKKAIIKIRKIVAK